MTTPDGEGDIACRPLDASDYDAMAGLLAEAFSRGDPLASAVGQPADEIRVLVQALREKALHDRLSVVALTQPGGALVGALLAEDFGSPAPQALAGIAPSFAPIGALLQDLDARYSATRQIVPGGFLHMFMVGVAPDFAGRGIARRLITTCISVARARGYRFAVTEATGSASQHLFRTLGFHDVFSTSYQDFRFEGRPVFASIVGPRGTILMERAL